MSHGCYFKQTIRIIITIEKIFLFTFGWKAQRSLIEIFAKWLIHHPFLPKSLNVYKLLNIFTVFINQFSRGHLSVAYVLLSEIFIILLLIKLLLNKAILYHVPNTLHHPREDRVRLLECFRHDTWPGNTTNWSVHVRCRRNESV